MTQTTIRLVRIDGIKVVARNRKEMGDLASLAVSIEEVGLLQPIGIDDEAKLVFGERRLRACRDLLGWESIPAVVVDCDALQAERDENEVRKDFTVSERVAIAQRIKERLGERRGRPVEAAKEIRQKIDELSAPTVLPPGRTDDDAARAAGFGNRTTLRQAEKVVEQGTPELVEAMDAGEISVSAAATAAGLPPEAQREVVAEVKAGRKASEAVREKKAEPPVPVDALGLPLAGDSFAAFADLSKFDEIASLLRKAQKLVHELAMSPGGAFYRRQLGCKGAADESARHYCPHLKNAASQLKFGRPHASRCPYCCREEAKPSRGCQACRGLGWVTEQVYSAAPEDYRRAVEALAPKKEAAS